jgi:hypothetical protein
MIQFFEPEVEVPGVPANPVGQRQLGHWQVNLIRTAGGQATSCRGDYAAFWVQVSACQR